MGGDSVFSFHPHGIGILDSVLITLVHIGSRSAVKDDFERPIQTFQKRTAPFARFEAIGFKSEEMFFAWIAKQQGRTGASLVLLDNRGRQMTSEAFAAWLGGRRDEGVQHVVFAVGPPSGWSDQARDRAGMLLSLGQFTLVHPLARLVMAEQIYRASTILTGHPYHTGH